MKEYSEKEIITLIVDIKEILLKKLFKTANGVCKVTMIYVLVHIH